MRAGSRRCYEDQPLSLLLISDKELKLAFQLHNNNITTLKIHRKSIIVCDCLLRLQLLVIALCRT